MESVGSELKSQREKRNLSLAQIAEDTRISLRYLKSMEEGRYADLPGGMYNRAFLRAYCERLNIDQKEIIRRYEEEISPLSEKSPKSKTHISSQNPPQQLNPFLIWSAILLILAAVIFFNGKWFASVFAQCFHARAPEIRFEPPKQPAVSPPASNVQTNPQPTPSKLPTAPGSSAQNTANSSDGKPDASVSGTKPSLHLELIGKEKCWVSISRDGIQALTKVIEPGEVQSFNAIDKFYIVIGNAGGIRLKVNGRSLKSIGQSGEVRRLLIDDKTLPDLLDPNSG
jgi:cytoskeleton protein RodZ